MTPTLRTIGLRLATLTVFSIVGGLYLARPDLGTVVGVVGTAFVALVACWKLRTEPAQWQLLVVMLGLPAALLYDSDHDSAAKQLVGGVMFGTGAVETLAILAAALAFVLAFVAVAWPRRVPRRSQHAAL
jgi:hypothetical protein